MELINPWIIYLAGVCESVLVISVTSIIAAVILSGILAMDCDVKQEALSPYFKKYKILPILCVSILLCFFVPSKDTVYLMAIAKVATVETLDGVKDEMKQDIIDLIKEFRGEKKEKTDGIQQR